MHLTPLSFLPSATNWVSGSSCQVSIVSISNNPIPGNVIQHNQLDSPASPSQNQQPPQLPQTPSAPSSRLGRDDSPPSRHFGITDSPGTSPQEDLTDTIPPEMVPRSSILGSINSTGDLVLSGLKPVAGHRLTSHRSSHSSFPSRGGNIHRYLQTGWEPT